MNLQQYLIALHVAEGLTNMNQKVTAKKVREYSIFNPNGSILEVGKDTLKDFVLMYNTSLQTTQVHLSRYKRESLIRFIAQNGFEVEGFGLMYGRIGLDSDDCIISIEG